MELSVDPDSDSSGEENSIERSAILPTELEPKDLYILRPFPTLIGSATFYETDHLGLRLEESSSSDYGSDASESEGESSGTETEVRMREKPVRAGLAEDIEGSSGDLFSENEAHVAKSNKVREESGSPAVEEGTGLLNSKAKRGEFSRTNHNNSSDEGNLFGSSSDEDLFSEESKKAKKQIKQTEKQVSEETAETIPTATSSKDKGKKKKIKKKMPAGAIPVFGILDSDDSDDESEDDNRTSDFSQSSRSAAPATAVAAKTGNLGLFGGDSDSEGDLFSPEKPKEKSKADITKPIKENKQTSETSSSKPAQTLFGGGESNFDSGSDEDLFEASTTSKNTVKSEERAVAKKPIGGVQLFSGIDQAAILGNRASRAYNREETTSPVIPVGSAAKSNATGTQGKDKPVSLYDNSSSDDDLFTSMSKATEPSKNRVEQTDKPPQGGKSTPIQVNATEKPPSSKQPDLFISCGEDSGDDLFSKPASAKSTAPAVKTDPPLTEAKPSPETVKNTPSEVKPDSSKPPFVAEKEPVNAKVSTLIGNENKPPGGLFQVDSDSDDDLFSIISNKSIKAETKTAPSVPEPTVPPSTRGVGANDLFSENDELFSAIQSPESSLVPTFVNPNPSDKPRPAPALYSATEKEDGGLFDAPASLNLFVTSAPYSNGAQPPKAKPKPASLFSPIVTSTGAEGGLFDQLSPLPTKSIDTLPQQNSLLPSLTVSRPKYPGRRPPSQKIRQERAENASIETLLAPSQGEGSFGETGGETETHKTHKVLSGAQSGAEKNKDFLKELNKAMGKGMAPGESVFRKKSAQIAPVSFEQEGDLFSNTGPKEGSRGAERGPDRMDGFSAPEEPSRLVGVSKSRPKPPGKRLPNRTARATNFPAPTEDFGGFYTEPLDVPIFNANKPQPQLFNGDLEDDLFGIPSSTYVASKSKFPANILAEEDDTFQVGDLHKPSKQRENDIEDVSFPNTREPPRMSKLEDPIIPVLPVANLKQNAGAPPQDIPEDLFASIALPKATKSSKTATKERKNVSTPVNDREDPLNSKPTDPLAIDGSKEEVNDADANAVRVDKTKKHRVVKQSDNDLFGGDQLFDAIPKGERTRKKKTTDANKKPKKPKKETDPATVDDLFD